MFGQLPVFRLAMQMARHATAQQAVASENIANADTPRFQARRLTSFQQMMDRAGTGAFVPRSTRPGHMLDIRYESASAGTEAAPNGNAVSIETEMLISADAARSHNRALAIYRSHLSILRAAIQRN